MFFKFKFVYSNLNSKETITMSTNKNKRKHYDIETKQSIIKDYNETDTTIKLSVAEIMTKYEIKASSTLYTIVNQKNQDKIKAATDVDMRNPACKKIKLLTYPEIDKAMEIWFREVKQNANITLDGPLMQEQALKFSNLLGITDFKASNGWLDRFKTRMNISFKKIVGEAGVADQDAAKTWIQDKLPDIIKKAI